MRAILLVFCLALALACVRQPNDVADAQPAFTWPEAHRAAIALTYDDAAPSQLQYAVPQLDAAGLKGTFFLEGRTITPDAIAGWRAVASGGHELGNHTINHPCARGSFDMPAPYYAENYTVETMLTEVRTMNAFLTALDGKAMHSFATPCGQNLAGGHDYVAPLMAAGLATHVRGLSASGTSPAPIMFLGPSGVSGADLIAWVEHVRAAGALGVVVFHGVGGDWLTTSAAAHQQLVTYLAQHKAEIWTATYSEAMDYVTAHGG